jgi:putative addiction module component (TIGR02574 family)
MELNMNAKVKALSQEARKLSPEERIELIEDLQNSLVPTDPEIDRAWAEEARDRLAAYRRGEIEAVSLEEVLANLAKK